ncbi:MAG: ABC-type transport auxiliary lipoprotein family protein [Smithella sp.]
MDTFLLFTKRFRPILFNFLFLFFCLAIIPGCVSTTGKPQAPVEMYLIDYPAPTFDKPDKINGTIRVNRFTIATAYNSNHMIFRQDNYAFDSFNYNRWAVNPADMVGDILLRDLQAGGLFRAVFSRYTVDEGRYVVQGGIDEFFLRKDGNGNNAVISLAITLTDTKQRESGKRIVFQKKYSREETLTEQSPRGYCQAMSRAVQKLSAQIINDISQGIKSAENAGKQ